MINDDKLLCSTKVTGTEQKEIEHIHKKYLVVIGESSALMVLTALE